jgi:hypothetical protein
MQASLILILFLFTNTVSAVSTLRGILSSSNTSVNTMINQQKKVTSSFYTRFGETCVNAELYNKFKFDKRYIGGYHSTGIITYDYKYNICFIKLIYK